VQTLIETSHDGTELPTKGARTSRVVFTLGGLALDEGGETPITVPAERATAFPWARAKGPPLGGSRAGPQGSCRSSDAP
jgi:hypothetical protein